VTASGDAQTKDGSDGARSLEDLEVAILGCGAAGSALARALAPAGPRLRLWSRTAERAERLAEELSVPAFPALAPALSGAHAALLCVHEDALGEVAARCAEAAAPAPSEGLPPVALHTNGFRGTDVLAPLAERGWATGKLHPLVALAPEGETQPLAADPLRDAWFALEGSSVARALARRFVAAVGGRVLVLVDRPEATRAYHAAASLLSGGVVALGEASRAVLAEAVEGPASAREALLALLASTLRNLERLPAEQALTGPAARGSIATVAGHVAALERADPSLAVLYRQLGLRMALLAERRGSIDAARRAALERVLKDVR
jgi:predicted short-subunit dehydrogenase-like oxidoreductase (DUF2520 family)